MNRSLPSHVSAFSLVEPLETRIAPAVTILVGAPAAFGVENIETNYTDTIPAQDAIFVDTETAGALDPIAPLVGVGAPGVADTFYVKLSAGDKVRLFNSTNSFEDFIIVRSGNVVAFFVDKLAVTDQLTNTVGRDNEVQANELVGLALGKGASIEVKGSVLGDVVTNLNELGTSSKADDTLQMTGLVSSRQSIAGLTVGGNISGAVYTGGPAANVTVNGSVREILAGTAASGKSFDFFPNYSYRDALGADFNVTVPGGDGTLAVTAVAGEVGPGFSKVRVNSIGNSISAGNGGAGAAGGSLSSIQVISDTDGFTLQAGAGGAGAGTRINGGAGGSISTVHVFGVSDPSLNSPNPLSPLAAGVRILSGDGGDALTNGRGGAAGKMTSIFVGYELAGSRTNLSSDLFSDAVEIRAGTGGDGRFGGAGGAIVDARVAVSTPEAAGTEIAVIAGAGGAAIDIATGKAGAGGSVTRAELRDVNATLFTDIELRAGDAGTALGAAFGSTGGSVATATILGSEVKVLAGNGSTGKVGGSGGSVTSISLIQKDGIVTNKLQVDAGFGGDGADGNAGNGGNVTGIRVEQGDFTSAQAFQINAGAAANGGVATGGTKGGKGGNGGRVTSVDVIDLDSGNSFEGLITVRSGKGGDGRLGGGAGGAIDKIAYFGDNLQPTVTAGDGGNATVSGAAGLGGSISNVNIAADGNIVVAAVLTPVSTTITAGKGGDALGAKFSGGAGGNLKNVEANSDLDVTLRAGNGGSGGTSAFPGRGGSILTTAGFAVGGAGILAAGDAGALGLKAAAGGSITGTAALPAGMRAETSITMTAGNGSHGGAGGSIKYATFGSTSATLNPTPTGNILIQAGNGSAEGAVAGVGGAIDNVVGNPSSGTGTTTKIIAGAGGGTATSTRSASGGSVTNLTVTGVDEDFVFGNAVVLTIEAGHAGTAPLAKTGGTGGSVRNVAVGGLDSDTVFRSVAAGDGGAGTSVGGTGGTIDGVYVSGADIGVRSGQVFGYATMGGVFAGAGGAGTKLGVAGSVRNIVGADAIASIVAGRADIPKLVERVERIVIGSGFSESDLLKASDQDLALIDDGGDPNYRNFDPVKFASGNLVGAVANPFPTLGNPGVIDGNKFKFTNTDGSVDLAGNPTFTLGDQPIDGLLAARIFVQSTSNFIPEASLVTTNLGKTLPLKNTIEATPGSTIVAEVQSFLNPGLASYTLNFAGAQTGVLPPNASAAAIQTALNALPGITSAGGVTVAVGPGGIGNYLITFATAGKRAAIAVQDVAFFDHDNKI